MLELMLSENLPADKIAIARDQAHAQSAPVSVVSKSKLTRLARTDSHQGYLAKMGQFPYAFQQDCLKTVNDKSVFLILDRIQDPHNLGAIIRSAEVFGVQTLFISSANQVPITTAVARSSAGAVNRIDICQCDLIQLADELTQAGIKLIGASEKATTSLYHCDMTGPTAVIIGNEASGITPELLELCSTCIKIEQHGVIGSLNAATAAGIFIYEANRPAT